MYLQAITGIEDFLRRHARWLYCISILFVGVGIAATLFHLLSLAFLQRIEDPVPPIYWAMGRAILNGFTPYEDIYETKPPGIFVLSALSLKLFGGPILGNIIYTVLLLSLPLLFVLAARGQSRSAAPRFRRALMALAFLGCVALLRYLLPVPSGWQLDFHGAAFSMLYLLAIADTEKLTKTRLVLGTGALIIAVGIKEPFFLSTLAGALVLLPTWRSFLRGWALPALATVIAGTLALLIAGWLDEYSTVYLPSMFGGYLQRHTLSLWQRGLAIDLVMKNLATFSFALPLLLVSSFLFLSLSPHGTRATALARTTMILLILALFLLLAVTGPRLMFSTSRVLLAGLFLGGIVALLLHRKPQRIRLFLIAFLIAAGALLLTSFQWCTRDSPLFQLSVLLFSALPGADLPCIGNLTILGVLTLLPLFLLPFLRRFLSREILSIAFAACAILTIVYVSYFGILIYFFLDTPLHPLTPLPPLLLLFGMGTYFFWHWKSEEREAANRVLVHFFACFLAFAAVSLGTDFQNQHYMAAVPFYAALLLASARSLSQHPEWPLSFPTLGFFLSSATLISFSSYPYSTLSLRHYRQNSAEAQETRALAKESAARIDAILDRCGVDRYYIVKLGESDFNPFHGFTKHSPLNFFYWAGLEDINSYHPLVAEREVHNFNQASIIIMGDQPTEPTKPSEQEIKAFLEQHFTQEPWPCAQGLSTIPHRTILYRRRALPDSLPPWSK